MRNCFYHWKTRNDNNYRTSKEKRRTKYLKTENQKEKYDLDCMETCSQKVAHLSKTNAARLDWLLGESGLCWKTCMREYTHTNTKTRSQTQSSSWFGFIIQSVLQHASCKNHIFNIKTPTSCDTHIQLYTPLWFKVLNRDSLSDESSSVSCSLSLSAATLSLWLSENKPASWSTAAPSDIFLLSPPAAAAVGRRLGRW